MTSRNVLVSLSLKFCLQVFITSLLTRTQYIVCTLHINSRADLDATIFTDDCRIHATSVVRSARVKQRS